MYLDFHLNQPDLHKMLVFLRHLNIISGISAYSMEKWRKIKGIS